MRFAKFCALAVSVVGMLQADRLTYTVSPNASGFDYNFILANEGSTGGPLFDLFLAIPTEITNIDTGTIGRPTGWGDGTGGLLFFGPDTNPSTSFIQWSADFSGAYDLVTGASLAGFSFSADEAITPPIRYAVNGSLELGTAQGDVSDVVPEAGTFGLTVLALGVFGLCRRFVLTR